MREQRWILQAGGAAVYLGLLVAVLRLLMEFRAFSQEQDSFWGVRGQLLLFALFGLLVVGQALWGSRNRLGSAVVAGVLTLTMATSHAGLLEVRWLSDLWWALGLWSNATLLAVAWGGSVGALGASFYGHLRPRVGEQAEEHLRA